MIEYIFISRISSLVLVQNEYLQILAWAMTRLSSSKYFLLSFLILFVSLRSFGQAEKAEAELQGIMKKLDVVGLSVAVVKDGNIIYTHSFGLKNIALNTPLTDKDIFRIASISKSFSATSIGDSHVESQQWDSLAILCWSIGKESK